MGATVQARPLLATGSLTPTFGTLPFITPAKILGAANIVQKRRLGCNGALFYHSLHPGHFLLGGITTDDVIEGIFFNYYIAKRGSCAKNTPGFLFAM